MTENLAWGHNQGSFFQFKCIPIKWTKLDKKYWHMPRGVKGGKEKVEKKNNELSGHFVCHAARLQHRTGRARTSLAQFSSLSIILRNVF
jgi:hypothetical protein